MKVFVHHKAIVAGTCYRYSGTYLGYISHSDRLCHYFLYNCEITWLL